MLGIEVLAGFDARPDGAHVVANVRRTGRGDAREINILRHLVACCLPIFAYFGGAIVHALLLVEHDRLVAAEAAVRLPERMPSLLRARHASAALKPSSRCTTPPSVITCPSAPTSPCD